MDRKVHKPGYYDYSYEQRTCTLPYAMAKPYRTLGSKLVVATALPGIYLVQRKTRAGHL